MASKFELYDHQHPQRLPEYLHDAAAATALPARLQDGMRRESDTHLTVLTNPEFTNDGNGMTDRTRESLPLQGTRICSFIFKPAAN
jgi:hypothetical protein